MQALLRGRRGRAAAACGTGSRCRRPGGRAPCPRTAAPPRPRAGAARRGPCSASASSSIAASSSRDIGVPPAAARWASPSWSAPLLEVGDSPSPSSPSTPRLNSEKYTSKTVSNARWWRWCFTSVALSTALEHRRGRRWSMYSSARIASRFSVIDTGRPAVRSSCTNPWRTSSSESATPPTGRTPRIAVVRPSRRVRHLELLARLGDVGLVLEQHVQRLADHLGVDSLARGTAACGPSRWSPRSTAPS